MVRLFKGNRMLKEPLQAADRKAFLNDPKSKKMYLIDHLNEIERLRGYLPTLMNLKRLVKKCECSYRDEDQYSSIKDSMIPNRIGHRINLVIINLLKPPALFSCF